MIVVKQNQGFGGKYRRTFGFLVVFVVLFHLLFRYLIGDSFFETNKTNFYVKSPQEIEIEKIKMECCIPMKTFEDDRSQYDQCLIEFLRDMYIMPPPVEPFKLNNQPLAAVLHPLIDILKQIMPQGKGFFVESGANDGEYHSNTFVLERDYHWTGLLIEPDRYAYEKLESKGRNASLANLCLSPINTTKRLKFYVNPKNSHVNSLRDRTGFGRTIETVMECVPLYAILKAVNVTTIDFFSLDIEGSELQVLQTIPFEEIVVKLIQVENRLTGRERKNFDAFLASKDFVFIREIEDFGPTGLTDDSLYIHRNYLTSLSNNK